MMQMATEQEEATYEEQVQRRRTFAHHPSSTSSDAADVSETFACETRVRSRSVSPRPVEQSYSSSQSSRKSMDAVMNGKSNSGRLKSSPVRMANATQGTMNHRFARHDETNNSGPRKSSLDSISQRAFLMQSPNPSLLNQSPLRVQSPNPSLRIPPSPNPSVQRQSTSLDNDVTQRAFRALYENATTNGGGSMRSSVSGSVVEENDDQFTGMDASNVTYETPMTINDLNHPPSNPGMKNIFHVDEATSKLVPFNTFEELSTFLQTMRDKEGRQAAQAREIADAVFGNSVKNLVSHMTIGEYLHKLHTSNKLTDVIIDVRGVTFQAHRVVLCCHSKYFNNLFTEAKSRRIPFELKIKGVSARAFASFLDFCYTGEINVSPEIAADLLIVSDHLQVPAMKKHCSQITGTLPLDQAIKFMVNCSVDEGHKLFHNLFDRVLKNFGDASKFDEFLAMDVERLCQFLASDDLVVQSELQVFQAALRWIIHSVEDRIKYAMRLMAHVRFCYMTVDELHTCAETTGLLRGFEKFREMILIAGWQISSFNMGRLDPFGFPLPPMRTCFLTSKRNRGRNAISVTPPVPPMGSGSLQDGLGYETLAETTPIPPPATNVDILLFGCGLPENASQTQFVERFDTHDNQWSHYCKLPVARRGHAVAALKGKIYIVGGCRADALSTDPGATNGLYAIDINDKSCVQLSGMNTARRSHCVAISGGKLYVMGGMDEYKRVLKTVECYDPVLDTWKYVCPMNSPRSGACAASLGGNIIVAGGVGEINGQPSTIHVLNTVEGYNVITDCWTRHNNMRFPRCYASLVTHQDRMFLIGGATRSFNYRSSVLVSVAAIDMYDEEGDVWHHVTDMVIPRHEAGAAMAGDRLYIIGGVSTVADRALQSVECLDCQTMRWVPGVQDLPQATGSVCCTSITSKWQQSAYPTGLETAM